jgi:hypothetical protein
MSNWLSTIYSGAGINSVNISGAGSAGSAWMSQKQATGEDAQGLSQHQLAMSAQKLRDEFDGLLKSLKKINAGMGGGGVGGGGGGGAPGGMFGAPGGGWAAFGIKLGASALGWAITAGTQAYARTTSSAMAMGNANAALMRGQYSEYAATATAAYNDRYTRINDLPGASMFGGNAAIAEYRSTVALSRGVTQLGIAGEIENRATGSLRSQINAGNISAASQLIASDFSTTAAQKQYAQRTLDIKTGPQQQLDEKKQTNEYEASLLTTLQGKKTAMGALIEKDTANTRNTPMAYNDIKRHKADLSDIEEQVKNQQVRSYLAQGNYNQANVNLSPQIAQLQQARDQEFMLNAYSSYGASHGMLGSRATSTSPMQGPNQTGGSAGQGVIDKLQQIHIDLTDIMNKTNGGIGSTRVNN